MTCMLDLHAISILTIGFLLGAKHALDVDHVAAVSTIAVENRTLFRSCIVGLCWGLGHTTVLLLAGTAILVFGFKVSGQWSRVFEAGVGLMLIGLGASVAWRLWQERFHVHVHSHDDHEPHLHLHSHAGGADHRHLHRFRLEYKSVAIGMIHGLAGSAAVLLLVLSNVGTLTEALVCILVFGVGSIAGMAGLAMLISLPFVLTGGNMVRTHLALRATAGVISVVLGTGIVLASLT
ncbi:MAG: urease accessory protein [Nitrospirae bacterium]|nr:MAG: urease accessory protein [Nitrospirota bacterium]